MMTIASIRKNTSFTTIALLVVIGALFFFGIRPLHGRIADERDNIEKLHAQEENAARKIQQLPDFQAQSDLIDGEDLPLLTLLSEEKVVDFIKSVEEIALKTGNTVVISQSSVQKKKKPAAAAATPATASAGDETDAQKAATAAAAAAKAKTPPTIEDSLPWDTDLRLSISATGTYPNVIRFLHGVETLPYALDVISSEIRVSGERSTRSNGGGSLFAPVATVAPDGTSLPDAVPVAESAPQEVTGTFELAAYYQEK